MPPARSSRMSKRTEAVRRDERGPRASGRGMKGSRNHRQLGHQGGNGSGGSRDGLGSFRRPPSGETLILDGDGILELHPPDVHPDGTDLRPYKRLAAAVIQQALLDAQRHGSDEARRWLSEDSDSLRFWCQWLGIDPDWVHGTGSKVHRGRRERGTLRAWG